MDTDICPDCGSDFIGVARVPDSDIEQRRCLDCGWEEEL